MKHTKQQRKHKNNNDKQIKQQTSKPKQIKQRTNKETHIKTHTSKDHKQQNILKTTKTTKKHT